MISEKDKTRIIELKSTNKTWKFISESVGATPGACRKVYECHLATVGLPPKEKLSKRLIQGHLAVIIKRMVEISPSLSYRDIENELKRDASAGERLPSHVTIRSFLLESGYLMVKLVKKPLLSEKNRQKRLIFAENGLQKPVGFWDNVIWSDETMVRSNPNSKDIFVKVHKGVKRENLPFNTKSQNQGIGVMFWGCFTKQGLGPLVAIDGTMKTETYRKHLEDVLLPEIQKYEGPMVFMQDNAPCHKAQPVMGFLRDRGITTLDWPAQSPDLNPIENLWAIIKLRRAKQFGMPTSRNELINQVSQIWREISDETRINLSNSIIKRLNEVIK